jgi:hypothetical protein
MQDILLSVKQYRALIMRLDEINDDVTAIKHQSHPEEHYIDSHDLLMILHITPRTLRRWRNSGKLPYKKLGHRFYYRADCIMDVFKVRPDEPKDEVEGVGNNEHFPHETTTHDENEIQITCERCPLFVILNSED